MAQDMTGYPGCKKVPINVAVEKQTAHRIECEWWLDLSAWMTDEMEGSASVELSAQEKKKKKKVSLVTQTGDQYTRRDQ